MSRVSVFKFPGVLNTLANHVSKTRSKKIINWSKTCKREEERRSKT